MDSEYLYHVLAASIEELRLLGAGATFPEVSKGRLGEFRIPLPSLRRQRRLAAALSRRTDAGQEALEAARAQLRSVESLRGAVVRSAFNLGGEAA